MYSGVGLSLVAGNACIVYAKLGFHRRLLVLFYRITGGFAYEFRVKIAALGSLNKISESILKNK
jgi:hypothetical protein